MMEQFRGYGEIAATAELAANGRSRRARGRRVTIARCRIGAIGAPQRERQNDGQSDHSEDCDGSSVHEDNPPAKALRIRH
jgi:hypothetical protein